MKVRELLQIEIWSKRTTRKILVVSGIAFGVLVLGIGTLYEVEQRWLTAGERSLAKVALAQIDSLQDFGSLSDEDFDAKSKDAEAKIDAAKHAAVTQRDDAVALQLSFYFDETQWDETEIREALIFWQRHIPAKTAQTELGRKLDLSGTELKTWTRSQLHKILD